MLDDAVVLIIQCVLQTGGQLMADALHVRVQLGKLVGQADQLIERADLQIRNVEFKILAQIVLFVGHVVQRFSGLLAGLLAGRTDEPVLGHFGDKQAGGLAGEEDATESAPMG